MGTTQALVTVSPPHGPSISYFFPIRIGAAIRLTVIRFGCDASIPCEAVFCTCSVIHRMQVGFPFANCCCFLWYTQGLSRSNYAICIVHTSLQSVRTSLPNYYVWVTMFIWYMLDVLVVHS